MVSATRPPRPKAPLRFLLWGLAALVALIGAAWIVLAVAFPPARLRALAERQLQASLAREARFESARIGLWPPVRLTVEGLAIAEPEGFARGTAVQVRSLHLDLHVLALLVRRVVIRRLTLDRPAVHLVLRPGGGTNLDSLGVAAEPGRATTPMDLAVSVMEIRGGRILVDDLAAQRRIAFGLDSRTGFALAERGTRITTSGESRFTDVAFGPLTATQVSDLNQSLARLEWIVGHRGDFDLAARRLALARLGLRLGRTEVAFSGTVDGASPAPFLDLSARGEAIELGQVLSFLGAADARALQGISGSGRLDFDLLIRGRMQGEERPTLQGTLRVTDGAFRYPGAPAGVERLSFTAHLAPDSIDIPELRARVADQPIEASLAASQLRDPRVRFAVRGDLDLGTVAPLVAPKDTKLAGRAALDLRGRGRAKNAEAMILEGRARLAGVQIESPQLPKPMEQVAGEIEFSTTRARVTQLSAQAGQSSFTLDASIERPLALLAPPSPEGGYPTPPAVVDFALRSPYLDLEELLPATPGGPAAGNARGSGTIAIARLKNRKLDVENVTARVALEPGVVEARDFGLRAYGGRISGRARFDLRDPARPAVTLNAQVDSARADALLSAWTAAGGIVHGAVSTTLDLTAAGLDQTEILRTLSAAGLANVTRGSLGPAPFLEQIAAFTQVPGLREPRFDDWRLPFRVERGRVATGPSRLAGPYGEWRIAGAVGFDGVLDYAVSITLPPDVVARLGARAALVAGALADEKGQVLIDLRVSGDAKKPRVRLDEAATRDRLVGRASRALAEQQSKIEKELRRALTGGREVPEDSARIAEKQFRSELADSLKKLEKVGRDLLKGFFGGGRKDTTRR